MNVSETPPLESGLVFVEDPDRGAIQRLVLGADVDAETLWIDTGGVAETYGLLDDTRRDWQGIRIARAFQAHQHNQLVHDTLEEASGRTDLLVATNVAAHYEKADHPDEEIDRLFAASVTLLSALAHSLDVPCLVSAPYASEEKRELIRDLAVDEIEVERTGLGYRFASEDFETMGYWQCGWWQTTIPYWVDLFGVAPEDEEDVLEITAETIVAG